ncbi:MAG TPA: CHAT domain-containing protein [Candidatus Angelobacter sp.]|nr:CHAT domain-containing protein [Candidatus Angelobacter sp.]
MKYLRPNTLLAVLLGATLCAFAQASKHSTDLENVHPNGVVVEVVTRPEARETGIRAGDILLRWSFREDHGDIQSPFEWIRVNQDQTSKGQVRIEGLRGRKPQSWLVGPDDWGIETRPNLAGTWLPIYQEAQRFSKQGAAAQSLDRWRAAAEAARVDGVRWLECWLLSRVADSLAIAGRGEEADVEYKAAIDLSDGATRAALLAAQANNFFRRGDGPASEAYLARAGEEWQKIDPNGMMVANTFFSMGFLALKRDDFDKAEKNFEQCLSITKVIAPESSQTSVALRNLGYISHTRGNLIQAEKYYLEWLAIERKSLSRTTGQSMALMGLGVVAYNRGDWAKAERYYRKALEIAQALNSESQETSVILSSIGDCRLKEGDLVAAERYQERALAIRRKINSGSTDIAEIYVGLGNIAERRSNFGLAEAYDRQALAVAEKLVPPPAPDIARIMVHLGSVVGKRGDLESAEGYYRQALGMMEKLMPDSLFDIDALTGLAGVLLQQGRRDEALAILRDVIGKVENPDHLGGTNEDRSFHRAKYERFYQLYSALMLERGELQSALSIVERSRARTFVEMLAQSRINTSQGFSSELLERDRRLQGSLNAKWQYRVQLLSGKHTDDQLAVLDQEISRLREQYDELEAEMEAKGPALAQAQPLSASEIQQLLDPETVLIEYSLGEDKSHVFAVTDGSIAVFTLPKRSEIDLVARRLYGLVTARNARRKNETEQQREARFAQPDISLARASSDLSRMVLNPLASLLPGKKLLIVSDGALQYIPFAALPDPNHPKQLLVASHEIISLPSASVVTELRRQEANRTRPPNEIAVLADPVFDRSDVRIVSSPNAVPTTSKSRPPSNRQFPLPHSSALRRPSEADPESQLESMDRLSRSAGDLGFARRDGDFYLKRLIYTRLEAKSIMAVTPAGKGKQALDFQASRTMAMSPELSQYRIVHFATHGLVDNKHPELSGLVLSLVDRHGEPKDGFLDLQDIYNMKLPVDLVVLSACDTGLGEEINGEGLIGLTRGFMYAGASRVMASLWSVSDKATAELMSRFYKAMEQDGLRPPAALRRAQTEMQRQPRWRPPFYWAGFQLQGEWR